VLLNTQQCALMVIHRLLNLSAQPMKLGRRSNDYLAVACLCWWLDAVVICIKSVSASHYSGGQCSYCWQCWRLESWVERCTNPTMLGLNQSFFYLPFVSLVSS